MLTTKDIYREGAHLGVRMGVFLSVASLLSFMSDYNSLLSIIAFPMLISVPALHYFLLRSVYRRYGGSQFSSMWMLGIVIFVGGSMICSLATYCYLRFFDPDFFYRTATALMEVAKGRPDTADLYNMLKVSVEGGLLPSIVDYCMQMMLLTIFVGSLLTIFLIPIVRFTQRRNNNESKTF